MRQDPNVPPPALNTRGGDLEPCQFCDRASPFIAAVLAGLPFGQICTCALEQRIIERLLRQRRSAPQRVEGH